MWVEIKHGGYEGEFGEVVKELPDFYIVLLYEDDIEIKEERNSCKEIHPSVCSLCGYVDPDGGHCICYAR